MNNFSYYKWLYGNKCGCNDKGGSQPSGHCTCAEIMSALSGLSEAISELDEEFDELDLDDKEKVISEALHYLYHNKLDASAATELQTAVEELNTEIEELNTEIDELNLDNKEKVVSEALHYLYHNKAEASALTELQTAVTELQTAMEELDLDDKEKVISEALHYLYHNKLDANTFTAYTASTDFVTDAELSAYTYDKSTIDEKISEGGVFDPTQYYNKTATDALLADKLDASAYTPTDLTNYDTKSEVNTKISTATSLVNGALTAHTADSSVHVTTSDKNAWNAKQDPLIAGDNITISGNVISATADDDR